MLTSQAYANGDSPGDQLAHDRCELDSLRARPNDDQRLCHEARRSAEDTGVGDCVRYSDLTSSNENDQAMYEMGGTFNITRSIAFATVSARSKILVFRSGTVAMLAR